MIFLLFPFLISVTGLSALLTSAPSIPVGSEETAICRFTFDENWDGYTKTALFRTAGFLLEVPLSESDECELPEILSAGKAPPFFLTVEGTKDGETINTNSLCMQFRRVATGGRRLKKYDGPTEILANGIYPFADRYAESDLTVAVPTAADLESDTVSADALLNGRTAHDHTGAQIVGTIPTYDGPTVFSEPAVIDTAGKYLEDDLTVELPAPAPAHNLAFGDEPPENTASLWMKTPAPEKAVLTGTLPTPVSPQFVKKDAVLPYSSSNGRTCLIACAAVGTNIYLFGGINFVGWYDGREANDKIYRYDTLTDTFTDTGVTLPHPLCEIGCCEYGGKIYLFGGSTTAGNLTISGRPASVIYDSILVYDPAQNTLTDTGAHLPHAMMGISPVAVGDQIYCVAGYASARETLYKNVFRYDPAENTVTETGAVYPENTACFCTAALDGKIYCFGGSLHIDGTYSDSVYVYDTSENTFSEAGTLPTPLDSSAAFLCGDTVYLIGGMTDVAGNVNTLYAYHLKTNVCEDTGTAIPVYDRNGNPYPAGHTSSHYAIAPIGNTAYLFGGMEGQYFDCLNTVVTLEAGSALDEGSFLIGIDPEVNRFTLLGDETFRVETGVSGVLRGVGSGTAYPVDAFLYDENAEEWVEISTP